MSLDPVEHMRMMIESGDYAGDDLDSMVSCLNLLENYQANYSRALKTIKELSEDIAEYKEMFEELRGVIDEASSLVCRRYP